VVQQHNQPFFLGDGTFARSPRKLATGGSLREVVGKYILARLQMPLVKGR
jgi:hypothetical protein